MRGRPNIGRVRVLVMYRKWTEEPEMYKYRYVGIIGVGFFLHCSDYCSIADMYELM
jgi:hypothetical protein